MQCDIEKQGHIVDGVRLRQVVPGLGLKLFAVSGPMLSGLQPLPHCNISLENMEPASHGHWL
jgi:hypothetical protein